MERRRGFLDPKHSKHSISEIAAVESVQNMILRTYWQFSSVSLGSVLQSAHSESLAERYHQQLRPNQQGTAHPRRYLLCYSLWENPRAALYLPRRSRPVGHPG